MSRLRYSSGRAGGGQGPDVVGGAVEVHFLGAPEAEAHRVRDRRCAAQPDGDLQQGRDPGAVVVDPGSLGHRVQMRAGHHHPLHVPGPGLGDHVAQRDLLAGRLGLDPEGGRGDVVAGIAEHAGHVVDAGVVAGPGRGAVAAVAVGDALQCLQVRLGAADGHVGHELPLQRVVQGRTRWGRPGRGAAGEQHGDQRERPRAAPDGTGPCRHADPPHLEPAGAPSRSGPAGLSLPARPGRAQHRPAPDQACRRARAWSCIPSSWRSAASSCAEATVSGCCSPSRRRPSS